MKAKVLYILTGMLLCMAADAQVMSLDSCRARALRANKQVGMARVQLDVAKNVRKSARTKYLPHIDLAGGYMYSSREISLLSDQQKQTISMMGTAAGSQIMPVANKFITELVQNQALQAQTAQQLAGSLGQMVSGLDGVGQRIVDAFSTNTHNIFTASAVVTQPLFMGGAITAGNRIADISEKIAGEKIDAQENNVIYAVDNAYWTVVSLHHKQTLAGDYLALVKKLDDDVHKMIREGVATRADGLKVDVAVNEAEMAKTKVDNGLSLARMLLMQLCGMPLDSDVTLTDEANEDLGTTVTSEQAAEEAFSHRAELQMLSNAIDIQRQQTKIARAAYLPQVALMGGVFFTNPSVYNGFERKFKGAFNVGVMVRMPLLDWGDNMYKIKAAKCATTLAELAYGEARELIELQVAQCNYRVREASKNLASACKNIERAEENLRCADIGFREGVMQTTDVMSAQTAWMQARTQKIDAEIEAKLAESALQKAVGKL